MMTDDALLRLARRHSAALTRFVTAPRLHGYRRPLGAAAFAVNGGLTDSCCKPSVTTRGARGEADKAGEVKPESSDDPPP